MKDSILDILRKYGRVLIPTIIIVIPIIWVFAHWNAEPGQKVSVLWGMIEYSKKIPKTLTQPQKFPINTKINNEVLQNLLIAGEKSYIFVGLSALERINKNKRDDYLLLAIEELKKVEPYLSIQLINILSKKIDDSIENNNQVKSDKESSAFFIAGALAPSIVDEVGKLYIYPRFGEVGYSVFTSSMLLTFAHQLKYNEKNKNELVPIIIIKLEAFFVELGLEFPSPNFELSIRLKVADKKLKEFCANYSP